MNSATKWTLRIAPALSLMVIWEILVRSGLLDPRFFPPLWEIGRGIIEGFTGERLISDILVTLVRLLIALALATIFGLLIGVASGMSKSVDKVLRPFVDVLYPIPKIALLPIILLMVGFGEPAIIIVTFMTAFLQIVISITSAVLNVSSVIREAGHNFGARGFRFLWRVILPAISPAIFAAIRTAIGLCFVGLIAVEFLAAQTGLGAFAAMSWQTLSVNMLYVAMLLTAVIGHGLNALCGVAERIMIPWYATQSRGLVKR